MRKRDAGIDPIILYPTKPSEFDIHADLYLTLKALGYDCHNQVSAYYENKKSTFDLVIFDAAKRPRVIIEIKDSNNKAILYGKKTNQIEKYLKYELPLIIYTPHIKKRLVIEKVKIIMEKQFGEPLSKSEKKVENMKVVY